MAVETHPAWPNFRFRSAGRSIIAFGAELAVFLAFFLLYYMVRGLPAQDVGTATRNALDIISLEQSLGIFREVGWQEAALGNQSLIDLANFTYRFLHLPLLGVIGVALFFRDTRKYRVMRNTVLLSGFMAGFIYYFYPVTPPRLLIEHGFDFGFVDTLAGARQVKPGPLTNHYAAMPSYHFGWILLAGIAIWWAWRSWISRTSAVLLAVLMWWAIVVTGNHFFLDMVVGAAMVLIALWLSVRWERYVSANRSLGRRFPTVFGHRLPF